MKFHDVQRSLGALALLAVGMASVPSEAAAQPESTLLSALRAGSSAAFKIASPIQVGNATAFQNNNGVITNFPAAARIVQGQLSSIYFRVNQGTLMVEGTVQGAPLQANLALQANGSLRIGVESQRGAGTLSFQVAVANDQIVGTYFNSSGMIVHGPGGAIGFSSSSSYGGNFRAALVPMAPRELPPLPPVSLQITSEPFNGRILLRWQPGDDPSRIRGYVIYREVDIMGERVRVGMVREPFFVDTSDAICNLSSLTPVVYSVVAVGSNGKESSPTWVQIIGSTTLPY